MVTESSRSAGPARAAGTAVLEPFEPSPQMPSSTRGPRAAVRARQPWPGRKRTLQPPEFVSLDETGLDEFAAEPTVAAQPDALSPGAATPRSDASPRMRRVGVALVAGAVLVTLASQVPALRRSTETAVAMAQPPAANRQSVSEPAGGLPTPVGGDVRPIAEAPQSGTATPAPRSEGAVAAAVGGAPVAAVAVPGAAVTELPSANPLPGASVADLAAVSTPASVGGATAVVAIAPEPVVAIAPEPVVALPEAPASEDAPALPPVAESPSLAPASASTAAAPEVAAARDAEVRAIEAVLGRYRTAFNRLDAVAAAAVWPTVNAETLTKAFNGLEFQSITFEGCQISTTGASAEAACHGQNRYVLKVGSGTLKAEARRWTFRLSKANGGWKIDRVAAR